MNRALLERIIGAAVLVVVVVMVVPVFLDGPANPDDIVSEPVALPGQPGQKSQTVLLERDREAPVPAAAVSEAKTDRAEVADQAMSQPASESLQAPPKPKPESEATIKAQTSQPVAEKAPAGPPVAATALPDSRSSTGMWAVQLGSFSDKKNAEKLAADLRKQGYAAFLSQLSTGTGELHRVRVGPQKDRASAEAVAKRLKLAGHTGQVVPHP